MSELKNCPFCGGKARWNKKTKAPECSKCLATIPSAGDILRKFFNESGYREYIAELWNRRVSKINSNCYNTDCFWYSNKTSDPTYYACYACPQRDGRDCIVITTEHTTPLDEQE